MGNTNIQSSQEHQNCSQNQSFKRFIKSKGPKGLVSPVKHSNLKQKKKPLFSSYLKPNEGENSETYSMTPENHSFDNSSASSNEMQPSSSPNFNPVSLSLEYGIKSPAVAPVQGDIQSTSNSHLASDLWSKTENCLRISIGHEEQNSDFDNFSFETASLPYDDEHPSLSIEDEDISIEDEDIRISELSIPKQFKTSSRASTSGFSSNLIKHHVQSRDAIEENESGEDEMSFPTASGSFEEDDSLSTGRRAVRSEHIGATTNEVANRSTCKQIDTVLEPKLVKVFVTYVREDNDHLHTVVQLVAELSLYLCHYSGPTGKMSYKFQVTTDLFERNITAKSKSIWLENNIKKANYVLVCVSRNYAKLVEEEELTPDHPDFENSLHAQYIYRRIHSEFINNGSKNYRFIPILVGNATVENVPLWLRDTFVYNWEKEREKENFSLIFRLIDKEEHLKPMPGPTPKLFVTPRYQKGFCESPK